MARILNREMKIILMGTPRFVVPIFDAVANNHEVAAVFTRAPKPVGRKQVPTKTPVHEWAESRSLPVFTSIEDFDKAEATDYILVAAYGVILKDHILSAASCINVHPSDLPKYRGASPIASAIMNGERESAVCLIKMDAEIDAGAILMRERFQIGENDTVADVTRKVSEIGARLATKYLASSALFPPVPQAGEPTFTRKILPEDEVIDWSKSVVDIHNQIRAIGGRTRINGADVKILETRLVSPTSVSTILPLSSEKAVALEIVRLQPAGRKPMDWRSFINGTRGSGK
jgi:methionyl-tRNA formyltransferase